MCHSNDNDRYVPLNRRIRTSSCIPAGVALVAVLSILTVLAVLALVFSVHTELLQKTSQSSRYSIEAMNLANAGLEHAKAQLWYDAVVDSKPSDAHNDIWRTAFDGTAAGAEPEVNVDLIPYNGPRRDGNNSTWQLVHDEDGALIGRYAVYVEDESGKIHMNVASLFPPHSPTVALTPRDIFLIGDGAVGLPVSARHIQNFLRAREAGRVHNRPRAANEADTLTWDTFFPSDALNTPHSFSSISEIYTAMQPGALPTRRQVNTLRRYATMHAQDDTIRYDPTERKWHPRKPINAVTAREAYAALRQANNTYRFEPDSTALRRLAASTVDYRDENHVLSTVGNEYGIEAVCFNEVLANEGSRLKQPYYIRHFYTDRRVFTLAYYYNFYNYRNEAPYQSTDPTQRERFDDNTAFGINWGTVQRTGTGIRLQLGRSPQNEGGFEGGFNDFRALLRSRGSRYIQDNRVLWPENIWKNAYLCVYPSRTRNALPMKAFKIERNTENEIFINNAQLTAEDHNNFTSHYRYAQIRSWIHDIAYYAEHPEVSTWTVVPNLEPNTYYRVYIQETNLQIPRDDASGGFRRSTRMDVDGNINRYSEQEMHRLRYAYQDGKAIRADRNGCIDIFLTSSREANPRRRNRFNAAYFARPDIIELINISDTPISLRNWTLVANTGSLAYDLGTISHAYLYSREDNRRIQDFNPVIRPHEYFYLCNNAEIFDYDFGSSKNGIWGSDAGEQMPVFEISDDTWGVRFQISSIRESLGADGWTSYVTCENENWTPDQFRGEVAEFQTDRDLPEGHSPDGIRYVIGDESVGNTRNTLIFRNLKLQDYSGVREGDYVMIVGLPRIGGFVSMTLKNEYNQIASRMIQYGNPDEEGRRNPERWEGWSAEKIDPTREEWVLTRNPSFGGTVQRAQNRASRHMPTRLTPLKDGPFNSPGELQNVWRISTSSPGDIAGDELRLRRFIQGSAEHFTTSGIRLNPTEKGAHIRGWLPAFGEASLADTRGIADRNAQWTPGIWANQSVRILTGRMAGETFAVENNTPQRISVIGRSVPSRREFSIGAGDMYALGPGYRTPFYYTRINNDVGEWEWQNKNIPPGSYSLHLAGLNDSINTEEFLEENHNALLSVSLWNYATREYEEIASRARYSKDDMLYAGTIEPRHISQNGGIRLRLVAHGLNNPRCSGIAWFNYAYVSPLPLPGRININTAPLRVLRALPSMSDKVAHNIYYGIDTQGRRHLKPYNSIADVLNVADMTLPIFSSIANVITVRSDQYNVYVLAQRIRDVNRDGVYSADEGDEILAQSHVRAILDRSDLRSSGESSTRKTPTIRVIERETL